MSILYNPGKANVAGDSLSRLSMGSVEDDKNDFVHDVHRLDQLSFKLIDLTKGGVMVHNGFESSFVIDVKYNKDLDTIFRLV